MTLETIELKNTLPRVFENEEIPPSQIWRQRSLVIRRGDRVIIEAASGTGKSSLCAYLFGARKDFLGEILFNGKDIRDFSISQWQQMRRRNIAYLPQELSLFPELTALQNIKLKNDLTGHVSEKQIMVWMERLGIEHRVDYPVGKMSIGQQQRVAIIRCICQPFDFLLLDEPVSHLDETNNRIAAEMVQEEALRQGAAVITTSVGNQLLLNDCTIFNL